MKSITSAVIIETRLLATFCLVWGKELKGESINVPNALTLLRLALIPVCVVLVVKEQMIWAFSVFMLACFTDLLDGYIARKFNLVTKLGMWLDPLADKLMAVAIVLTFTIRGILPLTIALVVFAKELLMLIGGFFLLRRDVVVPADKFGKRAAFVLNCSIAAGFLYKYWYPYYIWAAYLAMAAVLVAFVHYAIKCIPLFKSKGANS